MDTIVTSEGRKYIAAGKFEAAFYSFSDAGAFYNCNDILPTTSSMDLGGIPVLEASNLPQDMITFEADDSGKLVAFRGSNIRVQGGNILTGSSISTLSPTFDSDFASLADDLLLGSINNFQNQYILTSPDVLDEETLSFNISRSDMSFDINDNKPIPTTSIQKASLDYIESLFMDKRLSHVPNFNYLPPVNKPRVGTSQGLPLGNFQNIGQRPIYDWNDLNKEIKDLEQRGYIQDISFLETSRENNLFCQMFEVDSATIHKLDVIDFGELQDKHVWFIGKVRSDSYNSDIFINMFTLIMDNS